MATFDREVRRVAAYVEQLRRVGRPVQEFRAPSSVEDLRRGLPITVGPGANPGIILRTDTSVELGNPAAGSCALLLWTDDPGLVSDGRITLIGPDVGQATGGSLPFGQVLVVGGTGLDAEDHQSLQQAQYVADQVEGYMVKSFSRHVWSRVSKDAAVKGFCFETLGRSLMIVCKSSVPKVQAMEVLFVTSAKEDVQQLDDLARDVSEIGSAIVKQRWKAKGFDLDCAFDCRSCHDRQVCDDIREVIGARKKMQGLAAAEVPEACDDGH